MSVRLTVVTANIGRGETTAQARANIRAIRHGFPDAVVGWQEIDEADAPDEHRILAAQFGPDHYRNVGFARACPISVPLEWPIVPSSARVTKACAFLPHATPDRWIVEVLALHPDLGVPVRFANGHYPLARLGGNQGRARWAECHASWVTAAKGWHRSGITTITTRDTNHLRNMPRLHPTERELLPNAISRITVVPGSVKVKRVGTRDVNLTVDGHNARGVDLELSVKS